MRKRVELIILLVITVLGLALMHLYSIFYTPASREQVLKVVNISKGASLRVIAEDLERGGLVKSSERFIFAARVMGAYKRLQAGEYELSGSMNTVEILDYLVKGKTKKHPVTVPEGYNIYEVAALLRAYGLVDEDRFIQRATDRGFARDSGIKGDTFEGYLFPDTYVFTKGLTEDEIITKMVERFKEVYTPDIEEAARKKGMDTKGVITLASIIEKETGAPQERELVSAVFHNRLKKGIKLQSDPTVIYDLKDFDGRLRKKHLLAKTPYNTYANYGLPPGPITNPGRASILAALSPSKEEYLYFVSKNDGTHYFSRSLKEHNNAVNTYQRSRKAEKAASPTEAPGL